MPEINLSPEQVIAQLRQSPFYLANRSYVNKLSFVQSPTSGDFCAHSDDPNEPVIFDMVGEIDRDYSFCSATGTFNPDREAGRFENKDVTTAKIRLAIREFSSPQFQQLINNDWRLYMDNIEAIHHRAFVADPKKMPKDRITPARIRRIFLQHNLVVAIERNSDDNSVDGGSSENGDAQDESSDEGSTTQEGPASNKLAAHVSADAQSDDDVPPLESSEPDPSPYSLEGWPVPADSIWRAELNSIAQTHTMSPLVAYMLPLIGEPIPIPPDKYAEVLPGAMVHVRFSLINYIFGTGKSILVGKIEEVNVLRRAPKVPDSPAKKRFMDITKNAPSDGPSKRSRSKRL